MKVLTYQALFFVPLLLPATAATKWPEAGGKVETPSTSKVLKGKAGAITGRSQFASFNTRPMGWEIQPHQPQHPKPERTASILEGIDGIEGVKPQVAVVTPTGGWEIQPSQPVLQYTKNRSNATIGKSQFLIPPVMPEWGLDLFQPYPHPKVEKAATFLEGDDGTQGSFYNWKYVGYEAPLYYKHPTPERVSAVLKGDEGTYAKFAGQVTPAWGFEPSHPYNRTRIEKAGAILEGDDGNQSSYVLWKNAGWEIQPYQPQHLTLKKRFSAFARGDEGNLNTFQTWFNAGWEIQPPPPPHPKPERSGSIQPLVYIENVFSFITVPLNFFEAHPPQPPHIKIERSGSIQRGDEGNQFSFVNWRNTGWEIQPHQPQHSKPERSGSLVKGDSGVHSAKANWVSVVPETQPVTRARPLRASLVGDVGDAGFQGVFTTAAFNFSPFDLPPLWRAPKQLGSATSGRSQFAAPSFLPWGFEPSQTYLHPRPEKFANLVGPSNISSVYVSNLVALNFNESTLLQSRNTNKYKVPFLDGNSKLEIVASNFYPSGWEFLATQPKQPKASGNVLFGRSQFAAFNLVPIGFEIQSWQPPHIKFGRAAATQRGGFNIDVTLTVVTPISSVWGHAYNQVFSPRRTKGPAVWGKSQFSSAADAAISVWGHQGYPAFNYKKLNRWSATKGKSIFAIFAPFPPFSWDIQSFQPKHRRIENSGAVVSQVTIEQRPVVVYAQGWQIAAPATARKWKEKLAAVTTFPFVETTFKAFYPFGWPVQPYQPQHPRIEKSGSFLKGVDGIDAQFAAQIILWGYEPWSQNYTHPRVERSGSLVLPVNIDVKFTNFYPMGWEIQPPPPPHRAPEFKYASLARGDDGTQATQINWLFTGWEIQPPPPPHTKVERTGAIQPLVNIDSIYQFIAVSLNFYEAHPPQPPHPRIERSGSIQPLVNIEAQYTRFFNFGWPIQLPQPPHRAPEFKYGSLARGDDGNQGRYAIWKNTGWEVQPPQPPHPRPEKIGSQFRGYDNIEARYINWFYTGWEIQPPPPPHPKPERLGSIQPWINIDPVFTAVTIPLNFYEAHPPQPPHPKPEHAGAFQPLVSIEGVKERFLSFGWPIQSWQPPHRAPEFKFGSFARGDEGNQDRYSFWKNAGWEIQPYQPPHRAPEFKFGSVAKGDEGNQDHFVFWKNAGWEVQPWQPPHRAPELKFGPFTPHIDLDAVFIAHNIPLNFYEAHPPQPPHPRPERSGSIQPIVVIDAQYESFVPHSWPIQPPQPPHPRVEKSATFLPKEDGIQVTFQTWFNAGWEIQPPQPPHPTWEIAASFLEGDRGGYNIFNFVPPTYDPSRIVYVLVENRTVLSLGQGSRIVISTELSRDVIPASEDREVDALEDH